MVTTSRDVAAYFGKEHRNVLRDIDGLLTAGAPPLNFEQGSYTLPATGSQVHRQYLMDRDGFTLLAMGFTGAEALKFKLAYIAEFNRMEATMKEAAQAPALNLNDPKVLRGLLLALLLAAWPVISTTAGRFTRCAGVARTVAAGFATRTTA